MTLKISQWLCIAFVTLTVGTAVQAQKIEGVATYQTKTTIDMSRFNRGGQQLTEARKKQIAERMKNFLEKEYTLSFNKDESFYLGFENPYFQIITRAINKCTDIRKEFNLEEHDPRNVNWIQLNHIYNNLLEYKFKKKLLDFNNLIQILINQPENIPEFDVIFIDEAQDLSPLQWKLFDILKTKTKDIYLAGDDDQSIFAWAGADVKRFLAEPAKEKTLIYSKRISKSIQ